MLWPGGHPVDAPRVCLLSAHSTGMIAYVLAVITMHSSQGGLAALSAEALAAPMSAASVG